MRLLKREGKGKLKPRNLVYSKPPLWSRRNIVASHLAGPGSIPGRVSFPGWSFFGVFPRQMSKKLMSHPSPDIIAHHNHKKIILYGRQWLLMLTRPKTYKYEGHPESKERFAIPIYSSIIFKAENHMPSDVMRFGLWLLERTACRCKNINLRICSELVYCESEIAELVYTTKSQGNKPTFLSSAVRM